MGIILTLIACSSGRADSKQAEFYMIAGQRATKVEAVIALAKDPGAGVLKCQPQELSERAALRNKKIKSN